MSEKKVGKRLLTWVLVLVMTLSLLPLNVLADAGGKAESQMEQTVSNDDFSVTKSATPNDDGSYNITLSVTPLKPPATKPLELVILLDLSGSMVWCPMEAGRDGKVDDPSYPDHKHYNNIFTGIGCTAVDAGMATSRIDTARNAINNMVSELQKKGVAFNLSVVKFADVDDADAVIQQKPIANQADVNSVASTLSRLTPNGGTYMVPGLNVAASQFTSDPATEKVFLMLADGDFDDEGKLEFTWGDLHFVNAEDRISNAATEIKDKGATAYTIGFAADVPILKDIASDPNKYSTAGNAATLNSIFAQITEEIKGVYVTDTMGADVSLRPGTASTAAGSGTAATTNGGITWNLAKLQQSERQTLTYTVTPNLRVGKNQYDLNGETTLHCGETTLSVPAPYVTLSAYQVTTNRYVNGERKETVPGPVQLLPEDGALLNWSSDPYNNAPFVEAKLNSEVQEDNSALLTEAKQYTLDLYYAKEYTVKWVDEDGTTVLGTETLPYGTSADDVKAKAPADPTKPADAQYTYTFKGWTPAYEEVKGDKTYTATYEATTKEYTVTFNSNGGSTVDPQTVKYNDKAKEPTAPTKSGYTFAGWYTDNEKFTTKYDFATPVTKDIPLYAKWTRNYTPRPYTPPTVVIPDDDALGLNTTDHFAYIVGYGNGEVRPQNNITRAEVATIFFRLLTDDVRDENLTKTNRYSDVAATSWYNTAVSTLSSMGIITGYPDGTFRPNAAITRAEFAAIAARFDHDGDKTAAKFSDIATHWAKDEISIAYNNGWITGYPDGTFGPQRDITRAETMTLVNRVLNRQPETEDDLLPNMTVWTDNANPNAWYYLAVQEATNSHYYEFKTNSKYEKWTELRETRDWTQLEK